MRVMQTAPLSTEYANGASVIAECHMEASTALVIPGILQPHWTQGRVYPDASTIPITAAGNTMKYNNRDRSVQTHRQSRYRLCSAG